MIKNGRPYTNENGSIDSALITDLSDWEQCQVDMWIHNNLIPSSRANNNHTSYGIKHILQDELNIYTTNNQFKDAMMKAGFNPVDPNELNWTYKVKETSPAFKYYFTKSSHHWKDTWQYQRILEILDDYWLSCPDEAYVEVDMYFRSGTGEEQTKNIVWMNPYFDGKLIDTETFKIYRHRWMALPKEEQDEYIKWVKTNVIGWPDVVDENGEGVIL